MSDSQHALYEMARGSMARQSPGWNDTYPGDPALAVLELAVGLSDAQEQIFDEVERRHYLAYLKLLGTAPRRHGAARLWAESLEREGLYQGLRFEIDGIPFEVMDAGRELGRVREVSLRAGGSWRRWEGPDPLEVEEKGSALKVAFSSPVPPGKRVRLWCAVLPEPGRTPPDGQPPFPVTVRGFLKSGKEFAVKDGTCGLLRSGFLSFSLPEEAGELCLELEGEPEGTPRLSGLVLEPVLLVQRRTRSAVAELAPPFRLPRGWPGERRLRFFLPAGEGGWREKSGVCAGADGALEGIPAPAPERVRVTAMEPDFPGEFSLRELAQERLALEEKGVLPGTLRVMVEEDGVWYDCPVRAPDPARTLPRGCQWDGERGELCFGDGRDFRIPRAGRVLVAGCACTMGSAGNGACGELRGEDVRLIALSPASGGRDGEGGRDAFVRAAGRRERLRAVSCEDYEALARETPGLAIEKVRAFPARDGPGVVVAVKPRSSQALPELTGWQAQRLRAWLERLRMIGVPVTVRGPVYVPVDVSVVIRAGSGMEEGPLREAVFRRTDAVTGPLDFGAELSYAQLFSALAAVPGVQGVEALEVRVPGTGREGGIRLDEDMLPYLRDFRATCRR